MIRPRVQLGSFGNAVSGHAFAGPAVVWRGGNGFREYDGTRSGGWSIGLGATLRTTHLHFRADLEDVIYRLALSRPGVLSTDPLTRHDLLLTVGIALVNPVPRRAGTRLQP